MILDDERDVPGLENIVVGLEHEIVPLCRGLSLDQLMTHTNEIENENTHYRLRGDLIEHLWALKGNDANA